MEKKRREYERVVARHAKLGTPSTLRMRLRIHLASRFNTDATQIKTSFCGRRIFIRSRTKGEPLNQAEWIVILAHRFKTAEAAARFGLDLQSAISAIAALGDARAIGQAVVRAYVERSTGVKLT